MPDLFKSLSKFAFAGILLSATAVAAADIPAKKQTRAGLYLTAVIDVRTRAEVSFVGIPTRVNANIPLMVMPKVASYDAKKETYKLQFNPDFVFAVESLLSDRDYDENTPIVLICRSGSRSAKAANMLHELGYSNIYSVVDGFEGDKVKTGPHAGHRKLNGWKNAGLGWTYQVTPAQHYIMDAE